MPAVPFKANAACRHHIPRQRHRVTNWPAYDAALRQRGGLTVWFTDEAVAAWQGEPRTTPGGQPHYSALAITTALTLRAVFRLALRQAEGLISSILQLLDLDLPVPDHSTLSRRAETLEVPRPKVGSEPVHLLVDSTGLRLCGPGEWLVEKHGTKRRRTWRVLHLATDANTGRICLPGADTEGCRARLAGRPPARQGGGGGGSGRRRGPRRPGPRLAGRRAPPSRGGRGRAAACECGAERSRGDRTNAARRASA